MKMTKKFISVFLAVMMVVTMIPMSVFAATTNNASDADAVALKNAMTAYETAMDGTVYKNMAPAYNAYVAANKAYDAYVYGDASITLSTYTSNLTSATSTMTASTWSYNGFTTKTGTWPASNGTMPSDAYANLAYCGAADTDALAAKTDTSGNAKKMTLWARLTPSTMIYDGITTPALPIMVVPSGTKNVSRYVYSVALTDDDGGSLSLKGNWIGVANSGDNWDYSYQYQNGGERLSTSSTSTTLSVQISNKSGWAWEQWNRPEGDTNIVRFNGSFADGVYLKEITPTLTMYAGSTSAVTFTDIIQGGALSQKVYVVNYKAVLDAINNNKSKLALGSNYSQGGASALMEAFDAATSFDFSTYFSTSNDYSGCASAIGTIVSKFNSATVTQDSANYAALRTAMNDSKTTYNSTASDKYTTESWSNFTTAYDAAKGMMANLLTTGYNDAAGAKTKADALNTARNSLVVNFVPADTTVVENTIDDALVAINNESLFTAESFTASGLATNTPQAQAAIWGSTASYKDAASVVDSTQQDMVDAWVVTIGEGIADLYISKDGVVYYGYSMNSAIEYAQSLTASDYSNYETVSVAIQNAQSFNTKVLDDTVDTSTLTSGIVKAKLDEYIELTSAIIDAVRNLKASFAKMPDGQLANTTTGTLSFSLGANHSDGKYYTVTYDYPAASTIFKTTHSVATVALDNATISFNEPKSNQTKLGAAYLDSINIDSTISSDVGEIVNNYDDRDHSMSDPSAYPGKLSMSQTVDGLSYKLALGNNSAIDGSGIFAIAKTDFNGYGRDLSGNIVTDTTFDFTESLLNTNGRSAGATGPNGSIVALDGTAKVSATTSVELAGRVATKRPVMTTISYENKNFSALIRFSYPGAAARVYYGYTANGTSYTQTVNVIDISGLIDLTNTCDAFTRANYTTTSWNSFVAALSAAKGDMDYANMTDAEILAECQSRYDNLMNAKSALVEAANNNSIDSALSEAAAVKRAVDNGETRYSTASYNAFLTARQEAINAINGTYSDDACLDLIKTDCQAAIDAIAQSLLDAIANLVGMADFTALHNAAATAIDSYVYSVDDLQAFANLLNGLHYLNLSADEKALVEGEKQAEINAETTQITNAIAALKAATPIDNNALLAAKARVDAQYNDPDAWNGVVEIKQYIDNMAKEENMYSPVTIYGATVYGLNYTQDNIDIIVDNALEGVTPQEYTVTVIDENNHTKTATYPYGTAVDITSISGEAVDWYYAYTSNTATNSEKYYTTSPNIKFVVKGDTTLRTVPKTSTEGNYKVTYVSSLNTNKVIAVDYISASAGTVSSLPSQPAVPYYKSTGYTLNGAAFTTSTAITGDVTVIANYTAISSAPTYTITYVNPAEEYSVTEYTAAYNDEMTFTRADAKYWIRFNSEEDLNIWRDGNPSDHYLEYVVFYGSTYTFRAHEDVFIASLSADDLSYDEGANFIDTTLLNTPAVRGAGDIVYSSGKFSMIGTYTLSDDYTLVEAGVLFSKDGSKTGLTFGDVDSRTVYRLKSSQHTKGNQFVISIVSTNIATGTNMVYMPYLIYADSSGNQHIVYADSDIQFTYSPNVSY